MPKDDIRVTVTEKEVIQGKLLAALDNEDKVAAVFDKLDLDILICCLQFADDNGYFGRSRRESDKLIGLINGFRRLRMEAFKE